jgi:hypothetical protein
VIGGLWKHLVRKTRRDADKAIAQLDGSLSTLGLPPAPGRVRVALRMHCFLVPLVVPVQVLGTLWVTWWAAKGLHWALHADVKGQAGDLERAFTAASPFHSWPGDFAAAVTFLSIAFVVPVFILFLFAYTIGPFIVACGFMLGRPWGAVPVTTVRRRVQPIALLARAVDGCAKAHRSPWRHRPRELRLLARQLRSTEAEIMKLHRSSGHLIARSHRRRLLKTHAGLVVSALHRAEARIDNEGTQALSELASLLMTIARRVAEGRIGALVDPPHLEGLSPARDWEPIRLAAAASLFAATALGAAFLPLPDGAHTYLVGGCGVLILTLLYGRRAYQLLNLLASIRGG